jgi:hypothetical protein
MISMKYAKNNKKLINKTIQYHLHYPIDESGTIEIINSINNIIKEYYSGLLYFNRKPICFLLIARYWFNKIPIWTYFTKEDYRKKGYMKKLIDFMITKTNLQPSVFVYNILEHDVQDAVAFMRHNNFPRFQDLNK